MTTTDVKHRNSSSPSTDEGLDWRHISCHCSTGKVALCGTSLLGRTPIGGKPPEEQRCPLCVVLYQATTNCTRCGRRWSGKAL